MMTFKKFNPLPKQFRKPRIKDPKVHTAKAIWEMLKDGMTSPQIGEELGIAASTVREYIQNYSLRAPDPFGLKRPDPKDESSK